MDDKRGVSLRRSAWAANRPAASVRPFRAWNPDALRRPAIIAPVQHPSDMRQLPVPTGAKLG